MTTQVPASMTAEGVTAAQITVLQNENVKKLTSGTVVASTSGTSIDFTGIPTWAKRVTLSLAGVSTNGTAQPLIQIGTSGGVQTTSYATSTTSITTGVNAATAYTNGWQLFSSSASSVLSGSLVLTLVDAATDTWAATGMFSGNGPSVIFTAGSKALGGDLDRIRLTTANGTDTFDAGLVNILYE